MECCLDAALQNIYFKCAAAKIRHSHHHMTKVLEPYVRMNEKKQKKLDGTKTVYECAVYGTL
jgi:hypothetical protein